MSIIAGGVNIHVGGLKFALVQGYLGGLAVRGKDVTIPGRRGRVAMNRVADTRTLLIEGWVTGEDMDEWRFWSDTLHGIFDPEFDPIEIELIPPYLGIGDTRTITARTTNMIPGPILGGGTFQRWSIELESTDPDWAGVGGSGSGS